MPPTFTPGAIQFMYDARLPEILTPKDWQKKKGIFAKIAGKTGIGEALGALEKAFKKPDWKKFHATRLLGEGIDWEGLGKHSAAAAQEVQKHVVPLQKELNAVRDLAKEVAEKFEANKLIPRGSTAHVTNLADTANYYTGMLDAIGTSFRERLQYFLQQADIARKEIPAKLKRLDDCIQRTLADLTVKSYTSAEKGGHSVHDSVCDVSRSVSIQQERQKEWEAVVPEWKRLSAPAFMQGVKDGEPVKAKLAEVQKAAAALKKVVAMQKVAPKPVK